MLDILQCNIRVDSSAIIVDEPPLPSAVMDNVVIPNKNRRSLVNGLPLLLASVLAPLPSHAAAPSSTSEAIRRGAANIPGYGQADVFYPISLIGKWKATRTIVVSEQQTLQSKLPLVIEYNVRFLQSIQDNAVVADRGFNQASLEAALNQAILKESDVTAAGASAGAAKSEVQSVQWTETNPNDLRQVRADGSQEEIKVTKRATDMTQETVSSSEFRRMTKEDVRGIPAISAQRVLQKWKIVNDPSEPLRVEGLEIVYDMGGGLADPMKMTVGGAGAPSAPPVISKSRVRLDRAE